MMGTIWRTLFSYHHSFRYLRRLHCHPHSFIGSLIHLLLRSQSPHLINVLVPVKSSLGGGYCGEQRRQNVNPPFGLSGLENIREITFHSICCWFHFILGPSRRTWNETEVPGPFDSFDLIRKSSIIIDRIIICLLQESRRLLSLCVCLIYYIPGSFVV